MYAGECGLEGGSRKEAGTGRGVRRLLSCHEAMGSWSEFSAVGEDDERAGAINRQEEATSTSGTSRTAKRPRWLAGKLAFNNVLNVAIAFD